MPVVLGRWPGEISRPGKINPWRLFPWGYFPWKVTGGVGGWVRACTRGCWGGLVGGECWANFAALFGVGVARLLGLDGASLLGMWVGWRAWVFNSCPTFFGGIGINYAAGSVVLAQVERTHTNTASNAAEQHTHDGSA